MRLITKKLAFGIKDKSAYANINISCPNTFFVFNFLLSLKI